MPGTRPECILRGVKLLEKKIRGMKFYCQNLRGVKLFSPICSYNSDFPLKTLKLTLFGQGVAYKKIF